MEQLEISPAGHDALKQRTVSARERQIMLLASGGSSSQRMLHAMGAEARGVVQQLVAAGLLQQRGANQAHAIFADSLQDLGAKDTRIGMSVFARSGAAATMFDAPQHGHSAPEVDFVLGDAEPASPQQPASATPMTAAAISATGVSGATAATAQADGASPTSLRSLRASKIYIVHMLEMVNKPESRRMAQLLSESLEQDDVLTLVQSMEYLYFTTKPALAQHMVNKLRTLLPQYLLSTLEKITTASAPGQSL